MTYYNLDGKAVTYEELVDYIISIYKQDRNAGRELIYQHGITWHALAERQLQIMEYKEAEQTRDHRES